MLANIWTDVGKVRKSIDRVKVNPDAEPRLVDLGNPVDGLEGIGL